MAGENCLIVLVDESSAMSAAMRDRLADGTESTKTNAERIATSINNLLKQLADGPKREIAVVGYRSDEQGQISVGTRWSGDLSGREFVYSDELVSAAQIEKRTKKVPRADGAFDETTVDFAVWYQPSVSGKAPQIAAFKYCHDLISRWVSKQGADSGQPLILHVFSGASGDGSPQMAIEQLLKLDGPGGRPMIIQCHVASSSALVTTAFPSKQAYLASGLARDLFSRASELSEPMRETLKAARAVVQPGARSLVHNAKIADLFRCLELAKFHMMGNLGGGHAAPTVEKAPSMKSDSPPIYQSTAAVLKHAGEPIGLAVILLDRSVADPFGGSLSNPCTRLQEAANEVLKQLSSKKCLELAIDTAIVSYGAGADGQPDIRSGFEGPLSGKTIVRNTDLPDGAIRVEESEAEVPNGVGGLVTIKKKTPIYFDLEPAGALSPIAAFSTVATIIAEWCGHHPSGLPPIILHLTRGEQSPADIEAATAAVKAVGASPGVALLHHLVVTESPCKSVAFPATADELETDSLRGLWNVSSPLAAWEELAAAKRPYITGGSRGFVVNGKFDVLGEEFANSLAPA